MSERRRNAEACLVAVCAHLSLSIVRDDNFDMWLGVIRDVLPDCEGGSDALAALRMSADAVAHAARGRPRDNAMSRLRWETERYYTLAAAKRFEAWKNTGRGGQ